MASLRDFSRSMTSKPHDAFCNPCKFRATGKKKKARIAASL
jgi:hypothetical protein